jgi:hypothetical protein
VTTKKKMSLLLDLVASEGVVEMMIGFNPDGGLN